MARIPPYATTIDWGDDWPGNPQSISENRADRPPFAPTSDRERAPLTLSGK